MADHQTQPRRQGLTGAFAVVAMAAVTAVLTAGCGVGGPDDPDEALPDVLVDPPEGFERFDGDGYSLVVPTAWEAQDRPDDTDVDLGLLGPGEKEDLRPGLIVASNTEGNEGYQMTAGPGGVAGLGPPDEQRPVTGPGVVRGTQITNRVDTESGVTRIVQDRVLLSSEDTVVLVEVSYVDDEFAETAQVVLDSVAFPDADPVPEGDDLADEERAEIEELVVAYLEANQVGDCDRRYELSDDRAEGESRDEFECDEEPLGSDSTFEVTRVVRDGDEAAVYFDRTVDDGRVLDQTATVRRVDGEWTWSGFFLF